VTLLSIYNAERDDCLPSAPPPAAVPSLAGTSIMPALTSGAPPSSFGISRAIGATPSPIPIPPSGLPSLYDINLPYHDVATLITTNATHVALPHYDSKR
jgi:hypothetical protein